MRQVNLNVIKDSNAVTLIELMVVLSIIGIMLGMATPSFFNYQRTLKLRTAARELASDVRYTRQLAISRNAKHRINFNGYQYTIESYTGGAWNTANPVKKVDIAQAYSGVTKTDSITELVFSPLGRTCVSSSDCTLSVASTAFTLTENDITKTKTITVTGVGNVKIQ